MEVMLKCPKCKGAMTDGCVVDHAGSDFPLVSEWAAEPPKMGWFGVKLKDLRQITTYRCTSCGYLESYAK